MCANISSLVDECCLKTKNCVTSSLKVAVPKKKGYNCCSGVNRSQLLKNCKLLLTMGNPEDMLLYHNLAAMALINVCNSPKVHFSLLQIQFLSAPRGPNYSL